MYHLNDRRRLWKYILFGILTFGIYDLIFTWTMIRDMNTACGAVEQYDREDSPNLIVVALLGVITLGIYLYVWYYKQGNRMHKCGPRYGMNIAETGGSYVLWILFGVLLFGIGPIVAFYLFMCNVNKLCGAYNRMLDAQSQMPQMPQPAMNPEAPDLGGVPAGSGGYETAALPDPNAIPVNDEGLTTSGAMGALEGIGGIYKGALIRLNEGEVLVLGRNQQTSNLIFPDPDVSRTHCLIRFDRELNGFMVTDRSTYGTFLNDTIRLKKDVETKCPVGSKLSIGNGNNVFMLR